MKQIVDLESSAITEFLLSREESLNMKHEVL
jgi:hypothetical protein